MRLRQIVFLVVLSLLVISTTDGQSPNGTVSGIVVDSTGAAIVGAEILIANDATGLQYPGKTNGDGFYLVSNLPPGSYRLQVSKVGFKTLIKPDITLNVQDALAINFTLPIGAVSEIVTVTGGAQLVDTQSGAVSTVIDRQFVENLPLNGRSFNTLLQLTPGVAIVPTSSVSPGQFSVNGQRSDANYFQVDGVSANFGVSPQLSLYQSGNGGTQAFNAYGGTSSLVSVDALQEFRVETSSFAPEYGRTPGGQVVMTTRSGTNRFHGSAFDYFRNDVLDANDWFANRSGLPRAAERQNDFGGILGGPIWREKTFFFFSYEGLRLTQPQTTVTTVPSDSIRASANRAAAPVLDAYPIANGAPQGSGTWAEFTGNYSNRITMDAVSLRLDHTFKDGFAFFGRFNWAPSSSLQRVNNLSNIYKTNVDTRTLTLGSTTQLWSRLSNSLRVNFSRQASGVTGTLDSFGGAVVPQTAILLPAPASLSTSYVEFFPFDGSIFEIGRLNRNVASQFSVVEALAFTSGRHQVQVGVDFRRLPLSQIGAELTPVYALFSTSRFASSGNVDLVDFLAFRPGKLVIKNLSTYAQDRWKVGSRLSVTYGLRWEINPPPAPEDGTILASWENADDASTTVLAPQGTPVYKTTYANVAPRVGIAYQLDPKNLWIIRGGWGLFHDLGTGIAPILLNFFPNSAFNLQFGLPLPVPNFGSYAPGFSTQITRSSPVVVFDPHLKLPYAQEWNVAIERALGTDQSILLGYAGQVGRKQLLAYREAQRTQNLPGGRIFINNSGSSNYNALQAQFKRRLSQGLQALVSYSWSHSIDTGSDDVTFAVPASIAAPATNRGSSDFDLRHSLAATLTYDFPTLRANAFLENAVKDWSVSTVFEARSGMPINIFIDSISGLGSAETRPDLVPGMPVWIPDARSGPGKKLNPAAFAAPSTPRQGDLPRNSIYGIGASQWDLSLQRKFMIGERFHLGFRTDVFNVLNHPNFGNPSGLLTDSLFGQFAQMLNHGLGGLNPLYQIGGPRSLQLSLRLSF